MAWMIKAGNGKTGPGAGAPVLSIESNDKASASGWRFVSANDHFPRHYPACTTQGERLAWHDVLAHLTAGCSRTERTK
jgi:hypothetical protein